ncbi:MAG TPA: hypothetical protein VHU18_00200 [Rhizomicrobium sp.]|jgi:hypothetical protein|nr:hypothetical protein [Rhizomicrobium sp.]
MTIRNALEVVVRLAEQGVIGQYAVAGAVATLNYIQPTLTEDLDILISVADFERREPGLILLTPIEEALARAGYTERRAEGIVVEGWPVQFLRVASDLDAEALADAAEVNLATADGQPLLVRVLRPEHVVATALRIGRLKDLARVEAFLEQDAVDLARLKAVLVRFRLMRAWREFCK